MSVVLQINYTPNPAMPKWSAEQAREAALQIAAIPVLHWSCWSSARRKGPGAGSTCSRRKPALAPGRSMPCRYSPESERRPFSLSRFWFLRMRPKANRRR